MRLIESCQKLNLSPYGFWFYNMRIYNAINNNSDVMKTQGNLNIREQCEKCRSFSDMIELNCGHSFCVNCLTFAYHKHKLNMNRNSQTKCLKCQKTVDLRQDQLRQVNVFTQEVLVPLLKQQEGRKQHKISNNQPSTAGKYYKTHEQSIEKLTPIGGRAFYSKCESPKNQFSHLYCSTHPDQQLSVVCLTCHYSLLCISCTAGKKHGNHVLKTLNKGLECVQEQLALAKLKSRQNIDQLEILKRRTDDRRVIVQRRWDQTTNMLKNNFESLVECINRKCQQIVESCNQQFQNWMHEVVRDSNRIDQAIKNSKKQVEKLADAANITGSSGEIIKKSIQIVDDVIEFKEPELECSDIMITNEWEIIAKQLQHLSEEVQTITTTSYYLKTAAIKASRSEEKLLKQNHCKRIKTNLVSLNSSRERKEKKCTKTEQDEKRNKSRGNYKTESSTKVTKINRDCPPAYLFKNLQKTQLPEYLADINPLTSSFKSTKMLSKSHLPAQEIKRKNHAALIKQRLQRKTFNGQTKQQRHNTQGMKKKKIPY